ncbi:hypothetical protein JCGZ_02985 [Jatropha curcas]|uniref:Uncharacterized protein n=1 Tax=Jatropha curcas TaxID=180498 RepID=A0A067LCP8_JATCU|nr:hypothetical protein JCGZ_02985 [Jatropha curcas]
MKEGKSTKLNNQLPQQHQNGHFSPFKFGKLLDPEASWDKDQLGDVLHWIRQFVALVCGMLWGAIPLVGGIWIGLSWAPSGRGMLHISVSFLELTVCGIPSFDDYPTLVLAMIQWS